MIKIKSKDLYERGWSEAKIKKWLGDKDEFPLRDVLLIENSSKFLNWKNRERNRTIKKNSELKDALGNGIVIREIPIYELLERAIKVKISIDNRVPDANWIFDNRERLINNFIRHSLVENYDSALKALNGHAKRDELYDRLRKLLDAKIQKVYPTLKDDIKLNDILFVLNAIKNESPNF